MTAEGLKIGEESGPRLEFRSFGQDFDRIHDRMAGLSDPIPEPFRDRISEESYIVSRASDACNAKIRGGRLEVKEWVDSVEAFERWVPRWKGSFPLPAATLREEMFSPLRVTPPELPAECDAEGLLDRIWAHPELLLVRVRKRRFGYLVHGAICEYAVVLINGARVVTVGAESTDVADLRRAVDELGMAGIENINYLQAIKRVCGMVEKPLANE